MYFVSISSPFVFTIIYNGDAFGKMSRRPVFFFFKVLSRGPSWTHRDALEVVYRESTRDCPLEILSVRSGRQCNKNINPINIYKSIRIVKKPMRILFEKEKQSTVCRARRCWRTMNYYKLNWKSNKTSRGLGPFCGFSGWVRSVRRSGRRLGLCAPGRRFCSRSSGRVSRPRRSTASACQLRPPSRWKIVVNTLKNFENVNKTENYNSITERKFWKTNLTTIRNKIFVSGVFFRKEIL